MENEEKEKRGRPKLWSDEYYHTMKSLYQTDNKRHIQNHYYEAHAVGILKDYIKRGNDIPNIEYLYDETGYGKITTSVLIELGRLEADILKFTNDINQSESFLITLATNLCIIASTEKLSVKQAERIVRDKRKEIKQLFNANKVSDT